MSGRTKILDRIRQLREKTADRGCTEAEALAAAAKAAELMAKHGLAEEDLVIEEASSVFTTKSHTALRQLWAIVALCTNTTALISGGARTDAILFLGVAPGPDIAVYLRDVCRNAAKHALAEFKTGTFYRRRRTTQTRKAAVADFLDAFVHRLGAKLLDLFDASRSEETLQLAIAHRDRNFRTTDVDFKQRDTRFSEAAWEGDRAGRMVNVAHGVSTGSAEALRIGRS